MLFSLAWLRNLVLSLLIFCSFTYSREDSLFTSSVTYCEPPETLLIQQFDVAYFVKNQSISFNISAASVQANVTVTANLLLNVYGLSPVNVTLDLCNILGGALCPLPMYNFTGSDSISLPSSLNVQDNIPGIAFKVPDLEGFAQLILTEVGTGQVKACVQATLSNGWSTHQPAVEWVTGGIALATLFPVIWQSFSPDAMLPFRFLDLFYLYQSIATTAFLSLNYPSTYRAFTLNFAWAMGLFSTSSSSSLQASINRMRHLTGGKLANATSAAAVGLVNRRLSPYNFGGANAISAIPISRRAADDFDLAALTNLSFTGVPLYPKLFKTLAQQSAIQGDVQTVTASSSNILQAGIPIYVNSIHIATANAFMTVFFCALILAACALGAFILGYAILILIGRLKHHTQDHRMMHMRMYRSFIKAWCLRLGLIILPPIIIFSFYQWTLKDSWLAVLLSVITFLAVLALIVYSIFTTWRLARLSGSASLFSDADHLASSGPLYAQYRLPRFYFFLPLLVASFLKAIFVAFIKGNGEVQVILMVILEGFVVISYIVLRPYKTKGGDVFSTYIAIIRLVCTGLMIAFVERLGVAPITRTVIGLVIAVIFSVTVLVTYINLILNSGIERLWKRTGSTVSHSSANDSILEKGEKGTISNSNSSEHIGRPINPTPEHRMPLDPHLLQPYPVSPTDTEQPSIYTRDSGTITVGSLLPRRWSFSPLNSPASSSQMHGPSSYNSHANSDNPISRYSDTPSIHHPSHP